MDRNCNFKEHHRAQAIDIFLHHFAIIEKEHNFASITQQDKMKKTLSFISVLIAVAITVASCSEKKKAETKTETEKATDSTFVAVEEKKETVTALPDTAYASASLLKYKVEIIDTVTGPEIVDFSDPYNDSPGIFTFRGNTRRDASYDGRVEGRPDTIIVDWEFNTAMTPPDTTATNWGGGSGWTGQPVYVNWPDSIAESFRATGVVNANFKKQEIIVGSLCHMLYFIDLKTGEPSRQAIDVRNPIKGSVSLDPSLNGNLYVGQGVPVNRPFGHLVIDLNKGRISKTVPEDHKAQRRWGAFDSSPLKVDKFLFWPGENGTLYKYVCKKGEISLHSALRYTRNGVAPGMEASISVYRNYGYTADNHGNVVCTNLNTLHPVWCFANGDDTDATVVVCEEDGKPYVYTGNEVDRKPDGPAFFRKLDALTGDMIWEISSQGKRADVGNKHFDGGYYASPLPGKGNCAELIFNNCVANTNKQNGDFIAIDRRNGKIVYRVSLENYAWSSPVGFLNEKNEMFIFTGDTYGNAYLINGIDGKVLCKRKVGNNFESSPVVIGNQVVVGSRGNSIYKMTIR